MEGRRLRNVAHALAVLPAIWLLAASIPAARAGVPPPCNHGTAVFKSCESPRRTCVEDADCADGKECTDDVCNIEVPNTTNCLLSLGHADTCGDTTRIDEAFDVQDFQGDNVRVPNIGNLPIDSTSGNAVCCPGPAFPCFVAPANAMGTIPNSETSCGDLNLPGAPTPGTVSVRQNTYVIQPDDPDPLPDQANFRIRDRCDAGLQGCSTGLNTVQFTAATDLITGCLNPNLQDSTPCTDTDGNECTTAGCDSEGECVQTHITDPPSTPCTDTDGDECTTAGCDGSGMCNQTHILCTTTTSSSSSSSSSSSTTTSSSSTTSSTIVTECGDAVVQPPETCDPPGSMVPPNNNLCRADCTYCGDGIVNGGETCDDGNNVDGQCPFNRDECRNDCTKLICKDPARIRFFDDRPDEFKVHALIEPEPDYDPSTSTVKIELRNANGVVYEHTLLPGELPKQTSSTFRLRNRNARTLGGMAYFQIIKRERRASSITFKTYGDLSKATESFMTLTVTIGQEQFRHEGNWRKLPNGWRMALNLRAD